MIYGANPELLAYCKDGTPRWVAKPVKTVFISSEGDLYPCACLGLPFDRIRRVFDNAYTEVESGPFGNIRDFWNGWNSEQYRIFREAYEKRIKENKRIIEGA